jgi:hypothetical protein
MVVFRFKDSNHDFCNVVTRKSKTHADLVSGWVNGSFIFLHSGGKQESGGIKNQGTESTSARALYYIAIESL